MKNIALIIAILLTAFIFLIDIITPGEVEIGIAYILPLIIVSRIATRRYIYLYTALVSVLLVVGYFITPAVILPGTAVVNRFIAICAEWAAALFLVRYRKAEEVIREVDRLKARQQAMDDFYSMVTHDIKSPLTTMLGYAELMADTLSTDKEGQGPMIEMVEAIKSGGYKLQDLTENFLSISKLKGSRMPLRKAPVNLAAVCEELKTAFTPAAGKKNVQIEMEVAGQPIAVVDKQYIERAVSNLLQNAINYVHDGGSIRLKAGSGQREAGGRRVHERFMAVSVEDDGPGIDENEKDKVFEKYYRCEKTLEMKGSGLGLAIVKAVAEAHGGRVDLKTGVGKGCVFTIYLPIA